MPQDPKLAIVVYCRSREQKANFAKFAKAKRAPLSRFCLSIIEEYVSKPPASPAPIQDSEEINRLNQTLRERELEIKALQADVRALRAAGWNQEADQCQFSPALVEIIQSSSPIHERQLLEALHIDRTNLAQISSLSKQLETLEVFGLVRRSPRGWEWI